MQHFDLSSRDQLSANKNLVLSGPAQPIYVRVWILFVLPDSMFFIGSQDPVRQLMASNWLHNVPHALTLIPK